MKTRRALSAIFATVALAAIAGAFASAQTTFPNKTVPLAIPTTVTGANPEALQQAINASSTQTGADSSLQPAQTTPATPAPSASNAPVVIGDTGAISGVLTLILQQAWNGIAGAANAAQSIGVRIYVLIATISIVLAIIPVVFSHEPAHYLRFVVERVVEMSLVIAVISNTWTGVGWFPAIIAAGANLGEFIGGTAAFGGTPTFDVTSGWNLNVLPGNILNFGGAMFSDIVSATVFTPHGILSEVTGMFNGTMLLQLVIAVLGLLSAIWAFFGFAYAAFRMLLTVLKTYLLAPLSILQGLLGSRRLASYGGSYFAGALVLAVEVCLTMIIVGLFYNIVRNEHSFFQQLLNANSPDNQCQNLYSSVSTVITCGVSMTGLTSQPISIAGLVVIDATVTFFLGALHNVPRMAADAIQGRFTASAQEAIQAMQSSPSPFTRAAGWAAGMTDSYAREGAVAATAKGVQSVVGKAVELGAMVAIGAFTGGAGTVAGAATAVGKGALLGGAEGAVASGIGNVAFGKFAQGMTSGADEGNTITSGAGEAGDGEGTEEEQKTEAHASRASSATERAQDDAASTDAEEQSAASSESRASSDANASSGGASDTEDTATQHVTMEQQVDTDPQAQKPAANDLTDSEQTVTQHTTVLQELTQQIKELTAAMKSAPVAAGGGGGGGAGSPAPASASAGGSAGGGGIADGFAELSESMSLGNMFTRRALYMSARQSTPPPLPQEDSATMQFTLVR